MSKEYAVGEFFKVGKDTYKVVVDEVIDCSLCDILWGTEPCLKLHCSSCYRNDGEDVCFILYDQEPDEEEENANY